MYKKAIFAAVIAVSILLFSTPSIVILPVGAVCGPGNASDTWTSSSGATVTIQSTACPGTNPRHTTTCTKDANIVVDNGNVSVSAVDNVQPNTGVRYSDNFVIGCPSGWSKTYGPFSGNAIPNCAYTDYYLTVHDSVTQETHTLLAESYGQSGGTCQV